MTKGAQRRLDRVGDGRLVGGYVLEDLRHQYHVEAVVGVGKSKSVSHFRTCLGVGGDLTLCHHRVEHLADVGHVGLGHVEGDDVCATPEHLERVPALPRTDVDHLGV